MRLPALVFVTSAALAGFGLHCGPDDGATGGGAGAKVTGSGGGAGVGAGDAMTSTRGGGGAGAAAPSGAGAAGGGSSTGTAGASSSGPGSFDDGRLFTNGVVPVTAPMVTDASTPAQPEGGVMTPRVDGGTASSTATCSIAAAGLTAVFTQTGADVTVVITATKCAAGSHVIQIHDGFSCDSSATRGPVWGGKRGGGIGGTASTITCDSSQRGSLTYTRSGSDPTLNWTVGDHDTRTDVTLHPLMFDNSCGTFF